MAHVIIDRRKNGKNKSVVNRQKFIRRVKGQVKEAVKDVIRDGNIEDILSDKGKKITVPVKDLNEPNFRHGKGGVSDQVHPGNEDFAEGDRFNRPPGGEGEGGKKGSKDGEGEDDFEFHLNKDEFLDIFFEDLELPDLVKKNIATTEEFEIKRAGFSTDGTPARLNVMRSMRQSKARRFALRSPKKKRLKELERELEILDSSIKTKQNNSENCTIEKERRKVVKHDIEVLKRKIKAIPFIDNMDIRYNRWEKNPVPITQAVMFCIMDVSGSMGEWEKEMAKRFFMLLYLFLDRTYERTEIVFIRHHTIAKEVNEDEFFNSRETGGTIVSPALELMYDKIQKCYPRNAWNIYGCQASDGDNWQHDCPVAEDVLTTKILTLAQYFAYVEIDQRGSVGSDLWPFYENAKDKFENFDMAKITNVKQIYPVFRGLFEKKTTT